MHKVCLINMCEYSTGYTKQISSDTSDNCNALVCSTDRPHHITVCCHDVAYVPRSSALAPNRDRDRDIGGRRARQNNGRGSGIAQAGVMEQRGNGSPSGAMEGISSARRGRRRIGEGDDRRRQHQTVYASTAMTCVIP